MYYWKLNMLGWDLRCVGRCELTCRQSWSKFPILQPTRLDKFSTCSVFSFSNRSRTSCEFNTHRRRDSTQQSNRVGVRSVLGQKTPSFQIGPRWKFCKIVLQVNSLLVSHKTGPIVPTTISSRCCSIPFTLNGNLHYSCTDDGGGLGCFYGDREWKQCRQRAG